MIVDHKGIARLLTNADFLRFVKDLEEEYEGCLSALLNSCHSETTHQLRGETRKLADILKAIRSSQPALPRANT